MTLESAPENKKYRLAVLDDYQGVAENFADWGKIEPHCQVVFFRHPLDTLPGGMESLAEYDVICCMRERTRFPAETLARLKNLKLLVTTGVANAAIDLQAAKNRGVLVCGTESPSVAASELAWAHIMALAKRLLTEDAHLRHGRWQTGIGTDLKGRTLGILGLGRHGRNLARYGNAFGMRCIAWSPNLTAETCAENNVSLVDRETLFRESDFLTIHLKLGERSRNSVTLSELSLMKPTAFLVNTSRGEIVNESDLIKALRTKIIAGAGLDVYDCEPLPKGHPLARLENTVLTPHLGYVTEQTYRVFYGQTVEAVQAWLAGKPVRTLN